MHLSFKLPAAETLTDVFPPKCILSFRKICLTNMPPSSECCCDVTSVVLPVVLMNDLSVNSGQIVSAASHLRGARSGKGRRDRPSSAGPAHVKVHSLVLRLTRRVNAAYIPQRSAHLHTARDLGPLFLGRGLCDLWLCDGLLLPD